MLSRETEQKLVEIFITLSIGEEKINKLKQDILSNYNINPIQIFFKLDLNNVGNLSKSDFSSFLNFFSINFSQLDIDYIFFFL
jgi:Ca2+-binding EF-hand superfamily protein